MSTCSAPALLDEDRGDAFGRGATGYGVRMLVELAARMAPTASSSASASISRRRKSAPRRDQQRGLRRSGRHRDIARKHDAATTRDEPDQRHQERARARQRGPRRQGETRAARRLVPAYVRLSNAERARQRPDGPAGRRTAAVPAATTEQVEPERSTNAPTSRSRPSTAASRQQPTSRGRRPIRNATRVGDAERARRAHAVPRRLSTSAPTASRRPGCQCREAGNLIIRPRHSS